MIHDTCIHSLEHFFMTNKNILLWRHACCNLQVHVNRYMCININIPVYEENLTF